MSVRKWRANRPIMNANFDPVPVVGVPSASLRTGELIDLCGHDEIILVQSFDLVGLQRDCRITPAEADVGMMPFFFRQSANLVDEAERLTEVREFEFAA